MNFAGSFPRMFQDVVPFRNECTPSGQALQSTTESTGSLHQLRLELFPGLPVLLLIRPDQIVMVTPLNPDCAFQVRRLGIKGLTVPYGNCRIRGTVEEELRAPHILDPGQIRERTRKINNSKCGFRVMVTTDSGLW